MSETINSSRVIASGSTEPYLITEQNITRHVHEWNPEFDENAVCDCGHIYYRHFDTYEGMSDAGCKYCGCGHWHPRVQKAGLLPYVVEDGKIYFAFMISSDPDFGGPLPQIAKGLVDPEDESSKHAAIREGTEELGFNLSNTKHEEYSVEEAYRGMIGGDEKDYTFKLYSVEVNDRTLGEPHFETKEVVWMTQEEFEIGGRQAHKELVKLTTEKIIQYLKADAEFAKWNKYSSV